MSFGETGHADPEPAVVRMHAGFVESANELNQIDRVLKRIARFIVGDVARPIAPKRGNIPPHDVRYMHGSMLSSFVPRLSVNWPSIIVLRVSSGNPGQRGMPG